MGEIQVRRVGVSVSSQKNLNNLDSNQTLILKICYEIYEDYLQIPSI